MEFQAKILLIFLLPAFASASFRVANGKGIPISNAPYMAALFTPQTLTFRCSAVIIASKFILSAAHCFYEVPRKLYGAHHFQAQFLVRVGSEFWNRGGAVYSTTAVVIAPRWLTDFYYFDIAICRLNDTLKFSEKVNKIALPTYRSSVTPNSTGVANGYGITRDGSSTPADQLQAVELPVWTYQECDDFFKAKAPKQYSPFVGKGTFCAGFKNETKTTCVGDSGGAFVIGNVLVGITSFGGKCGGTYPSYFAEVAQFEDMIDNFMKDHALI